MPEYRRFVAYFYEYIDGKKQGNAGFAKVELRNGMWRILFRLTLPDAPEPPMRVYGFVRERGYLPEFLLGTVSEDNYGPEEWAWRADAPVGSGKYFFEQMTGIRIQSGDGRIFLTVWDDAPVEIDRFVSEVPEQMTEAGASQNSPGEPLEEPRKPEPEIPVQIPTETPEETPGGMPREVPSEEPQEPKQEIPVRETTEIPEVLPLEIPEIAPSEPPIRLHAETAQSEPPMRLRAETVGNAPSLRSADIPSEGRGCHPARASRFAHENSFREGQIDGSIPEENPAEILLRGRQPFRPFGDEEFFDCVQIKLCDLLPLQQEGWQVGRSNFLQHGYYLYRHLLLGRAKGGRYVVGVPGLRSQQEEYVAHTFGYDRFKASGLRSCGRKFGYWCRVLNESGIAKAVSQDEKEARV